MGARTPPRPSYASRENSSLSPYESPVLTPLSNENELSIQGSPLYDASKELMPSHAYYERSFQALFERGKKLASSVGRVLASCSGLEASQATRLIEKSSQLAAFGTDVTRSVAILGDSGTGMI